METADFPRITRLLVAMAVMFTSMAAWNATAEAATCATCHAAPGQSSDIRPLDSAYRNITTGAFLGNHQTHLGPASPAADCAKCHGAAAASYSASHRNAAIEISANINSSPLVATYDKGTSFPQISTPTLGTCSNVNCHFEKITPTWGAAAFTAPDDCDQCHGAPPSGGATGAAGSHVKHDAYYFGSANCQKCHSNNTTFAHATSAGHRNLNISFAAAPNNGSGAYNGALNDYLPSQNPSGTSGFGTCSNLYCHSPGDKTSGYTAPNQPAIWGGTLGCAGCHAATPPTGSHTKHVEATYGVPVPCYKCHAVTVTPGMTISSTVNHVNKKVDIAFNSSTTAVFGKYSGHLTPMQKNPSPGTGYANCENVYCHSSGQGAGGSWPPTYSTPKWGVASGCGTCHNNGRHGGLLLKSGSHEKHLNSLLGEAAYGAVQCVICHYGTGFANPSCSQCHSGSTNLTTKHVNHKIEVDFVTKFSGTYNGSPVPGDGYGSCSTSYCHSDGKATPSTYTTPTWGNPASGACGTCHGVTAAAPPASVPHLKHLGAANQYRYACAECHSGKVQVTADSTIAPTFTHLTSHVNKVRNVTFDASNAFGTYSTATLSCRNLYCHSTGNISVAAGNLPAVYNGKVYARQTWSGTVSCNSCHGRSTSNGMPDYANGKMGSMSSNSHAKHVTSSAIACVECHEKTTKNNTAIRNTFPSKHVNAINHDVYFNLSGLSPSGIYDDALRKCSNTYCHGTGASLAWGGSTYCNSCHSSNAGTAGGGGINNWGATPLSAHKLHWEDTTALPSKYANYSTGNLSGNSTTYRFGCASCHNPSQATHVNGYANGAYRAQVFFGFTTPGKRPSYTYTGTAGSADNGFSWSNGNTACNATYCHSNGAGGNGAGVTWTTTVNSATSNTRCIKCHNYTVGSGAAITTGDHTAHISAPYNFSCRKCHAATTTDGSTITDKGQHVNKLINVAFNNSTAAVNGTYNGLASPMSKVPGSAYASCANTYCHSKGTSAASPSAPNVTATWGSTLNTTCSGCHGNDNGADFKMGTVGSATHTKHVQTYAYDCSYCHAATVTNSRTIGTIANHVNRMVDVQFSAWPNNTATYIGTTPKSKLPGSAVGACGNTYCHSNGTSVSSGAIPANTSVNWGAAGPLACNSCHGTESGTSGGAPRYSHLMELPTAQAGATWTTPANALLGDKAFATYAGTAQGTLILTSLGYTTAQVADTDTVTGITVIVKGWAASGTTPGNQLNVQLTQNGSAGVGTAKTISLPGTTNAANAEVYPTTTTTDLWGATWTPAQVRAATFGVILKDNDTASSQLNVDTVRVIVHTNRVPKMNNHSSAVGHRVVTCNICHDSVTYSGGIYTPSTTLHVNKAYNVQVPLGYTYAANGGSCATPGNGCHGPTAGRWGGTLGCVDCHNKTITRTKGRVGATLANVVGEFGLAWGHKKSGRTPVTDDDCIVCHLEGDGTSHKASAKHQDGNIDLRDPDGTDEAAITNISGGAFTFQRFSTSYAASTRYTNGQTLNNIDNVITQKFCLACHDSNGATNMTARSNNGGAGTPTRPFGGIDLGANYSVVNGAAAANSMVDVKTQLATTNSSKHPVLGPLNRDFPAQNRMNVPYQPPATRGTAGTLVQGVVINCFDCHNAVGTPLTRRTVTAHGNAVTIRGTATVSGAPGAGNDVTFCKVCHAGYVTGSATHAAGSAFSSTANGGMTNYLNYGCNVCHGSSYSAAVVRPVRAMDVHGVNVLPSGGVAKSGMWSTVGKPYAFIRNTYELNNHQPKKIGATSYTAQCAQTTGGPTCSNQGTNNYTAGGTF